jgi:hypothetical protein
MQPTSRVGQEELEGCQWPPKFRGSDYIQAIVQTKGRTLKYLSLTMYKLSHRPFIDPVQRITSFRDFIVLTHLEFDIRMLDCSKEIVPDHYDLKWIPVSIWKILPLSIQVVRVIIPRAGSSHILYGLLREAPAEKTEFPFLRKLVLRVTRKQGLSYLVQTLEPMQLLLDAVSRLGIEVELDEAWNRIIPNSKWDD